MLILLSKLIALIHTVTGLRLAELRTSESSMPINHSEIAFPRVALDHGHTVQRDVIDTNEHTEPVSQCKHVVSIREMRVELKVLIEKVFRHESPNSEQNRADCCKQPCHKPTKLYRCDCCFAAQPTYVV